MSSFSSVPPTNGPPKRTVIVAAIDGTAASQAVIQTASAFGPILGAELHFVHVLLPTLPPAGPVLPPVGEILREGRKFVDGVARQAAERFGGRVIGHLMAGEPYRQILQLASDVQADLIVVGSHGKTALDRLITGSVSQAVLKKAHCAVLVARPKGYPSDVPEIEPPCPMCVETQQKTHGEKLWCVQHAGRGLHNHTYDEGGPSSFGVGSMFIRPG